MPIERPALLQMGHTQPGEGWGESREAAVSVSRLWLQSLKQWESEAGEYRHQIFYRALFISSVPLFHKAVFAREHLKEGMMKMTISTIPRTPFLKLLS